MTATTFADRVRAFNQMYGLPVADFPTDGNNQETLIGRIPLFTPIIKDEVNEVDDIQEFMDQAYQTGMGLEAYGLVGLEVLVQLADWLGDMIVYCRSEAMRFGIPLEEVLEIIMDSNMSKLGADGQPIIVDGKVQKGPNYWKPEPKIRELLLARGYGNAGVVQAINDPVQTPALPVPSTPA